MRTTGHLMGAIIIVLTLVAVGAFVYAAANPGTVTGTTSFPAAAEAAAAAAPEAAPAEESVAESEVAAAAAEAAPATGSIKDTLTPAVLTSFFKPLPTEVEADDFEVTNELTHLGRMLFYDHRLSISQQMSCNTCHLLNDYGVDGLNTSLGHDGKPVSRNAPTVYNAAFHIAQFWDGRAEGVEDQAGGPMLAAGEMGMPDEAYVENVVRSIPGYEQYFIAAFGNEEPINFENVKMAIGAFERRLITPSRFDHYMEGDLSQLSEEELQGAQTFINVGCVGCHNGMGLGGMMYGKLGQAVPYEVQDAGRFAITGEEADKSVFKVPSLRNITETGPYLHDGSIATLEEMVALMGKYQLARDLTDEEIASIVTFLGALTGELPEAYIAVPVLPESGPDTASFANTQTQ